jgi:hypothetical protein
MNNNTTFTMSFEDFDKKFLTFAVSSAPQAAENGLFAAVSELKNDADTVSPKTPHLEGALRGIFDLSHWRDAERLIAQLVFMMPYAARWHEAENDIDPVTGSKVVWSEKGVGPKYVEAKLVRFMKKYIGITVDYIKAEMDKRLGAAK